MDASPQFSVFTICIVLLGIISSALDASATSISSTLPPILQTIYDNLKLEHKHFDELDTHNARVVFSFLLNECVKLTNEMSHLKHDKSELQKDKSQLQKDKSQLQKDKSQLQKDKSQLQKDKEGMKNDALVLQKENDLLSAMIDLPEYAEDLFVSCWPEWAGIRQPRDHSEKAWKILFMNVEHSRICNLKISMFESNVSEGEFIGMMCRFEKLRNENAHIRVKPLDVPRVYQSLVTLIPGNQHRLFEAVVRDIFFKQPETNLDGKIADTVIQLTNDQRKDLKLLKISKLEKAEDEIFLEMRMKEKFGEEIKPIVCIKNDQTQDFGYVLFKDFQQAYTVWKKKDTFKILRENYMTIIEASVGPYNGASTALKITVPEHRVFSINKQVRTLVDLIPNRIYTTSKSSTVSVSVPGTSTNLEKIQVKTYFLLHFDNEKSMETFGRCKELFNSEEPYIRVQIVCLSAVNVGKLTLVKSSDDNWFDVSNTTDSNAEVDLNKTAGGS